MSHAEYYLLHKDEISRKRRESYAKNPEVARERAKRYRATHQEQCRERDRLYRLRKNATQPNWRRDYYLAHKSEARAYTEKRRAKNPDAFLKYMSEYQRARKASDQTYAFRCKVTRVVWQALKKRGVSKDRIPTERILGYSLKALRAHLESQFVGGMTWENYGSWHIHHIIPQCQFSYTGADDPQFRACWALTNLQPLWAADHHLKHSVRADKQYEQNRTISI